jgi:hypothetical protein
MTKTELRELSAALARFLAAIEAGEIDASPTMVARLEGVRLGLELAAGPAGMDAKQLLERLGAEAAPTESR